MGLDPQGKTNILVNTCMIQQTCEKKNVYFRSKRQKNVTKVLCYDKQSVLTYEMENLKYLRHITFLYYALNTNNKT